jgi:hypothetical protein
MDVLKGELAGIAAWALGGAIKLEAAADGEKFVQPETSEQVVKSYHLKNNPFDYFLEARFLKNRSGFVANELVRREWKDWCRVNNVKLHVADNQLVLKIVEESSWDLSKIRKGSDGSRGIAGLSLKKDHDDEL